MSITIHDLPNELLDKIFSYIYDEVGRVPIISINAVCRRWNRPFMTETLWNDLLPKKIDLKKKFPRLTCLEFSGCAENFNDFRRFKGHASLIDLGLYHTELAKSVLDCPRLIWLTLRVSCDTFFKKHNLEIFLTLLPRLEDLDITVTSEGKRIDSFNQKLANILQSRPKRQLKLKCLSTYVDRLDFISFNALFQESTLDHFETYNAWATPEQVRKVVEFFPTIRSLKAHGTSILHTEMNFDHIETFKLLQFCDKEHLSFSSLLNKFPNAETLKVYCCPIVFDLECPTRIVNSSMSFTGNVKPHLCCHLKTLEWTIDACQFNRVMQELGKHCPQLNTIEIKLKNLTGWIVPELDGVVFPLLNKLKVCTGDFLSVCSSDFELNSSLVSFLARHGQLKVLNWNKFVKVENHLKVVESDQKLWPYLRDLELDFFTKCKPAIRKWFRRNVAGTIKIGERSCRGELVLKISCSRFRRM